eukprot:Opistho-2@23741
MNETARFALGALLPGLLLAAAARAEPLPTEPLARRCWLAHTAERTAADLREPVAVRFSNLRNGYALRSPFWVEFGVRGMGVIPAGNRNERAGHHHLLIDTPLPRDHQAQIPFSSTHKHFGKGQTGTELDLPEGRHTLRLLFADHEHRPYFVYSPEITVLVTGRRTAAPLPISTVQFEEACALWYQDQVSAPRATAPSVYVKNLRDEEVVSSPFVLSLGATGLGIAPAGQKLKDTGHFALQIQRAGTVVQRLLLSDGRTETLLDLPKGEYELALSLLDGEGQPLLRAAALKFSVRAQDR